MSLRHSSFVIRHCGIAAAALLAASLLAATAPTSRKTAPAIQQAPADFNHPPRDYEIHHVRDWPVLVEQQLATDNPDLARRALARFDKNLSLALNALPASARPRFHDLKFFILYGPDSRLGGRDNGLEYFQRTAPDAYHTLDPRMANSIVIYSAKNYTQLSDLWALKAVLHELAHAYHLTQWPETRPDIYDAWARAEKLGLYRNVRDDAGKTIAKAYALQNQLEYFAELSCMYFVGCNYYPFNRRQLETYDPTGYALIEDLWHAPPTTRPAGPPRRE